MVAKNILLSRNRSIHQTKKHSSRSGADNPVNRSSFNVDRETYRKERAEAEIQRKCASNIGPQTVH